GLRADEVLAWIDAHRLARLDALVVDLDVDLAVRSGDLDDDRRQAPLDPLPERVGRAPHGGLDVVLRRVDRVELLARVADAALGLERAREIELVLRLRIVLDGLAERGLGGLPATARGLAPAGLPRRAGLGALGAGRRGE